MMTWRFRYCLKFNHVKIVSGCFSFYKNTQGEIESNMFQVLCLLTSVLSVFVGSFNNSVYLLLVSVLYNLLMDHTLYSFSCMIFVFS